MNWKKERQKKYKNGRKARPTQIYTGGLKEV